MPNDDFGMHQNASPKLFHYAQALRENMTKPEQLLWEALRNKKLDGYKFRRQHPLGKFIIDFYCHSAKLAIEIDGGYHEEEEQKALDEERTRLIVASGVREIRFRNEEVLDDLEEVLTKIREALNFGNYSGPSD